MDNSFTGLHESMKQIALSAVEANKPAMVLYGTVVQTSPLRIYIDQKTTIDEQFLVLTSLVQNITVIMDVDPLTATEIEDEHVHDHAHTHGISHTHTYADTGDNSAGSGTTGGASPATSAGANPVTGSPTEHFHIYKGKKKYTILLALEVGEKVMLLREQGGNRYIVLDRVWNGEMV